MRLDFCTACGRRNELENHHIVPRKMGGGDDDSNVITVCILQAWGRLVVSPRG